MLISSSSSTPLCRQPKPLQPVTVEKRWSKGVSFLASYTASKNIADFTTSLERGFVRLRRVS
jgi:hypothetical protein